MSTTTGYKVFDRSRAFEAVASEVERSIADGRYQQGQRLPSERLLAESFGVSRVVIREAMRALESKGLVSVRQGSGTYVLGGKVKALSQDLTLRLELEEASLVELYVVRQALELGATRLAAEHATPAQVELLGAYVDEMRAIAARGISTLEQYAPFARLDEAFHLALAGASGNLPMHRLLGALLPLLTKGREEIKRRGTNMKRFFAPDRLALVCQEHADILTAIKNRDGRAAEHFSYVHMQRSIASWTGENAPNMDG